MSPKHNRNKMFNAGKKCSNSAKSLRKKKKVIKNTFNDWNVSQIESKDVNEINVYTSQPLVTKIKPARCPLYEKKKFKDMVMETTLSEYSSVINSKTEHTIKNNKIGLGGLNESGIKKNQMNTSSKTKIKQVKNIISLTSAEIDFKHSNENFTHIGNSFENCPESDNEDVTARNGFSAANSVLGEQVNSKKNKKHGKCKLLDLKGFVVLSLEPNTEVYMYGLSKIKILRGSVEILGYVIDKNSDEVEVYSPKGTSVLYIKSLPLSAKVDERISLPHELKHSRSLIEEMLDLNSSAVILCKKFETPLFTFIGKQIAQNIIPKTITSSSCMFRQISSGWEVTKKHDSWNDLVDKTGFTSKVFLCGGKDVGKSTLLRYLVNALLKKFNEVCVVDLDPGQPEFTIPGCISTTIVTEPLLGPNYTHIRKPDKSLFISNIDITLEPNVYLMNVKELLNISKDLMQLPTIINYMGYHRTIGLNLVASVINLVQPTIVAQIQSNNAAKNFEQLLDVTCVIQKLQNLSLYMNDLSYKLITIPSMANETTTKWVLSARQVRELCVLSYFAKALPNDASSFFFGEIPVYTVSLSDVHLRVENREASLLESNGRLVGLCSLRNSFDIADVYTCYGWGIIRGFDLKTNKLALLTPVPASVLDNVYYLVLGSVDLPPSVYMSQTGIGSVAFVSSGVPQFTSNIPKRKHFA